jgi:hypothetical protein
MDNLLARVECLERQARTVEQRLRWWRGLALALLVPGLVSWNLPAVIAAAKPGLESRVAALESLLKHFSRDGDEITITGANLHIVNGVGAQADCGVQEATDPVCPHMVWATSPSATMSRAAMARTSAPAHTTW